MNRQLKAKCKNQRASLVEGKELLISCIQRTAKAEVQASKLIIRAAEVQRPLELPTISLLGQGQGPDWERMGPQIMGWGTWVDALENLESSGSP